MGAGAQWRVERTVGGRGGGWLRTLGMGVRIGGLGSGTRRWRGGEWGEGGGLTFPELTGDLDFRAFVPVVVVFWFDISPGGRFRVSGGCEIGVGGSEG